MEQFPCNPEIEGTDLCGVYRKIGRCFMDIHHRNYPSPKYRTTLEKEFRELETQKEETCRQRHNDLHAELRETAKPSRDEMQAAVNDETLPKRIKDSLGRKR